MYMNDAAGQTKDSMLDSERLPLPVMKTNVFTDRELIREKYLKTLPQNMSGEVDTAKSFGGKNALMHLKEKRQH